MKIQELHKKNIKELQNELIKLFREQFNLRMQAASGNLSKSHLLKIVRRNIARIKMLITKKMENIHE